MINSFNREDFKKFYTGILRSYSEDFIKKHENESLLQIIFSEKYKWGILELESLLENITDVEHHSILSRIIGVTNIIESRENQTKLDITETWKFISSSILNIPLEYTISSIGSQGFLSIPLYKYDPSLKEFDFLRLHIWDESLNQFMDLEKCELFGIHTHTFYAKSWIITGEIINERFDHVLNSESAKHSVFKVKYNDSLNNVNQHTSIAVNEHIDVKITKTSHEVYFSGDTYEIAAGRFHRSNFTNQALAAATFFSFTGKDGLDKSIVVGPKNIEESEVNRKVIIDPTILINKINSQMLNNA